MVSRVKQFEQSFLDECLLVERSLVLDDLNGNPLLLLEVIRLHNLATGEMMP